MAAAALTALRSFNSTLGATAPGLSARVAERLFTSPRRHTPPLREQEAERAGQRSRLRGAEGELSVIRWGVGRGRPRILAMHGWEGRATQWGPLALAAVRAGFEVVAPDAPGHGHSYGRRASAKDFVEAMLLADAEFGPFTAVLGHSIGAASTGLALHRGLRAERAVLISGPARVARVLRDFAGMIGLSASAEDAFMARIQRRTGIAPADFDIAALARGFSQPALIVHSRDDREVEFGEAEALAAGWSRASLLELDGLGHRRILRDPELIESMLGFAASPLIPAASSRLSPTVF